MVYAYGGTGYSEMEGHEEPWEKGDVLHVPPCMWEHEHYNPSTESYWQLRIQYAIGYDAIAYADTTVFLKTSERLPVHTLSIAYARQEEWGSVNVGANGSSYLRDPSKHSASVEGGVSLRVVRGLNLNLNGGYSSIHG